MFTREDGSPLRPASISEHFSVLVRKTGLPSVRFHDLRHGAATYLIAAGVDIKTVSYTLGHSTVAFTLDVYATVVEEAQEDAAVKLAGYMPRKARKEAA